MTEDTGEPIGVPWSCQQNFPWEENTQLLSTSSKREITLSSCIFQKHFGSFLIYMFCMFSVYDLKGYWYWNDGKKGTDIKRYHAFIWSYLLFLE